MTDEELWNKFFDPMASSKRLLADMQRDFNTGDVQQKELVVMGSFNPCAGGGNLYSEGAG